MPDAMHRGERCEYLSAHKKTRHEVANPHAGFLNINLVSSPNLRFGDPIFVNPRLPHITDLLVGSEELTTWSAKDNP